MTKKKDTKEEAVQFPEGAAPLPEVSQEELNHRYDERFEMNEEKFNQLVSAFNNLAGLVEKVDLRVKLIEQKAAYEAKLAEKSQ